MKTIWEGVVVEEVLRKTEQEEEAMAKKLSEVVGEGEKMRILAEEVAVEEAWKMI